MTSINIPDMVRIVKEHGLIPVPVDINLETTAPSIEDLKSVITAKVHPLHLILLLLDKSVTPLLHLWNRVSD